MENFDLRITSTDSHNMQVAVSNSPAGEVAAVEVDVSHFSLLDWVDVRDAALREIAAEFTAQAMPDAIWRAWRESWTAAGDAGLRLRIRCEDADSARIPWELLYDAERNYFLAHDPRSPVVRYLEGPIPDTAKPIDGPLRVILSCASPANEEALQVTKELDGIQATLSKVHQAGDVEISRLDDLNLDALDKALVEVKPHVFHYSGHGVWDEHTDSGYLILDDGEGGSTRLPHTDLAMLLRSRGVALVVLNACESAMGDRMWDGLAQSLVLAGVPAVVAMQMTVTDGAAIAFGGSLYTALVNGYGLEHAVTLARQTVALQPETVALPAEWLVPLLFMRTGSERSWLRDKPDEQTARTGGAEAQVIDQRGADISVREDHVDTGGGTYIAGNVSVAGNYGATPEQYTDMFTRVFTLMGEIPQARSQLQDERTMLNSVRQQLGPLVQYKEAHDILQQMDSGYQIIYSLVYEGGELLPESQVRWPSLKRTCADLQLGMQRLRQTTSTAYFGSDLADSRRDLEQADADMQRAFADRDLDLFDLLLVDVQRVIDTQTPRMNDRLIAAVDALQLATLARRLADVHRDLVEAAGELEPAQVEQLAGSTEDITELVRLSDRLTQLRDDHDRWQQVDNELRTEQALLPNSERQFARRWQRSLGQRLRNLCTDEGNGQELALVTHVAEVDLALEQKNLLDLADAVYECRSVVSRRLNQIDHDLRTLCAHLKEADGPFNMLLEKLA